jgi:hypothetical protein
MNETLGQGGIPKMFHTPRHLVVLSRGINERGLRTSIKEMVFHKITDNFHFDFTVSVKHNSKHNLLTFSPTEPNINYSL